MVLALEEEADSGLAMPHIFPSAAIILEKIP